MNARTLALIAFAKTKKERGLSGKACLPPSRVSIEGQEVLAHPVLKADYRLQREVMAQEISGSCHWLVPLRDTPTIDAWSMQYSILPAATHPSVVEVIAF